MIGFLALSFFAEVKAQSTGPATIGADSNNDRLHENLWISIDGRNVAHFGGYNDPGFTARFVLENGTNMYLNDGSIYGSELSNDGHLWLEANNDGNNVNERIRFFVANAELASFTNHNNYRSLDLHGTTNLRVHQGTVYTPSLTHNENLEIRADNGYHSNADERIKFFVRGVELGSFMNNSAGYKSLDLHRGTGLRLAGGNIFMHDNGYIHLEKGNITLGEGNIISAGNIISKRENRGLIVDAGNNRRVGFMKYANREAGIWRTAAQDFEIGRVGAGSLTDDDLKGLTTDFYIAGNGNVGIGTNTPRQALEVKGTIMSDGLKLNIGSFPDYVFADNYDLMPLDKVEAYIKANKHLPNMPSEAQVVKNGMDVGQINTILVEKVEELTLYTIALKKELEKMKKELKALSNKK